MKKILIIVGSLILLILIIGIVLRTTTKSKSPESSFTFEDGDLQIDIFYNRPFKKGRVIFGGLVPFGKTWRTGANEATVFTTNKDLMIGNTLVKAGKYSLWTVPDENSWAVVFNSSIPGWGIDVMNNGEAARDTQYDVAIINVPVVSTQKEFEQFTISVEKADDMLELVLAWDKTLVAVPLSVNE